MEICLCTPNDIETIFQLYRDGTAYQKQLGKKHWKGFERTLIETEINEHRQWKIMIDDEVACVFAITFSDPVLWKERNADPAIYIHRIAAHRSFRGNGFVKFIVEWAKQYAKANSKQFIRMDTGSGNDKLNEYYMCCGFNYLGIVEYDDKGDLPAHYSGSTSLFEIRV
ncbi:MAG: GNAT family N-acetyltransferase [Ferruginibacter sp.]